MTNILIEYTHGQESQKNTILVLYFTGLKKEMETVTLKYK